MNEARAKKLIDSWTASWSDAPQPLYTHLNELRRLLIDLHCPDRIETARQALAEAYLERQCPDCE